MAKLKNVVNTKIMKNYYKKNSSISKVFSFGFWTFINVQI